MPNFDYRGRDNGGQAISGAMEAASASEVADRLAGAGVLAIDIRPAAAGPAPSAGPAAAPWWQRLRQPAVDDDDLMLFARQMATLQRSGVPILRAFAGLEASTEKPAFASLLRELRQSLEAGRDLASSLARFPRVFSDFFVAMVRIGEMTGQLPEVFLRLFAYFEFQKDMRERVRAALRYPGFVLAAMGLALVILNLFVIPVFARVFASFHAELPLLTRLLIGFSEFTLQWWWLLLLAGIAAAQGLRRYLATPAGRLAWGRRKLGLPIAGPIVLQSTLSRLAHSLGLALRAGVPVSQSLSVVARTVDNDHVAARVEGMRQGIERGDSFLTCAREAQIFTPLVLQMIAVGEESGDLDGMLAEVAQLYERETQYRIKGLAASLEPLLLAVIAVLVLILALGIFLPLWSLGQAAMGR